MSDGPLAVEPDHDAPGASAAATAGVPTESASAARGTAETPRWHAAIGYALVGEELGLPEPGHPVPSVLVDDLAAAGWPGARITGHARQRVAGERPWPHRIPSRLRRGLGAAQLYAALGTTRDLLGLVTLETRRPSHRTQLNPDEVRLLRDVPPHHGS